MSFIGYASLQLQFKQDDPINATGNFFCLCNIFYMRRFSKSPEIRLFELNLSLKVLKPEIPPYGLGPSSFCWC